MSAGAGKERRRLGVLPGQGDEAEHRRVGPRRLATQLAISPALTPAARELLDKKIADYEAKIRSTSRRKRRSRRRAEEFEEKYESLHHRDDQFGMARR
jgi:hypothetical protein